MSQSSSLPVMPARHRLRVLLFASLVLLGYLPLLLEHFVNLWNRPHYQYVLLLPLAVAWLVFQRWPEDGFVWQPVSAFLWGAAFCVGTALLAWASWLHSPSLAMLGLLVSIAALMMALGGRHVTGRLWPAWMLGCLAIPLPFNLDYELIEALRGPTTGWSSVLLDELGVLHLVSGNVIEMPSKSLFIADACTGIHSLFVLVAVTLFYCLQSERSLPHTVSLLVAAVGIVFAENVARVVGVALFAQQGIDVSEGWPHTAFGMVVFAVSLILIATTDQWFRFLAMPFAQKPSEFDVDDMQVEDEEGATDLESPAPSIPQTETGTRFRPQLSPVAYRAVGAFCFCTLVLGVTQAAQLPDRATRLQRMLASYPMAFDTLDAGSLPGEWRGWKQVDFRHERRVQDDPLGEQSQVWTYRKGESTLTVSLDYPFTRLHNLSNCYAALGWEIESSSIEQQRWGTKQVPIPVAHVKIRRQYHGAGHLWYTSWSALGDCEVLAGDRASMTDLIRKRFDERVPWFQIQAVATSGAAPSRQLQEAAQSLFSHASDVLATHCLREIRAAANSPELATTDTP